MGDATVVLITGTSTGIGRKAAVELARRGARVFGTMRDVTKAGDLLAEAAAAGVTVEAVPLDVRSQASVQAAVDHVVRVAGRLDVLVNNAATFVYLPVEFSALDDIEAVIDTNLTGAIRMIRAAVPVMRRQGSGRIVNVGSVAAEPKLGMPLMSVYGATKAGLRALSYDLNKELLPLGIEVLICEGGIGGRSAMFTPLHDGVAAFGQGNGAYAHAEDAARAVADVLDQHSPEPDRAGEIIADACLTAQPDLRHPAVEQSDLDAAHGITDEEYRRLCRGQDVAAICERVGLASWAWGA